MIKAVGEWNDGAPALVLGLSRVNTEDLLAGRSVHIDTSALDPRFPVLHVVLFAGETEAAMADHLLDEMGKGHATS